MFHRRAFTLVELLVVVGIIGLLISILLPTIARVRASALKIKCASNLDQLAKATLMYANDHRDAYPDPYTMGGAVYRMAPGKTNASDPFSAVETYGLAAVLHGIHPGQDLTVMPRPTYIAGNTDVWVCPAMPDWMKEHGNTYFMNMGNATRFKSLLRGRTRNENVVWLQDNSTFKPFAPGIRRTSGAQPTLGASKDFIYPHPFRTKRVRLADNQRIQGAANVLFIDGHVGTVVYRYVGGSLDSETIR